MGFQSQAIPIASFCKKKKKKKKEKKKLKTGGGNGQGTRLRTALVHCMLQPDTCGFSTAVGSVLG